VDNQGIPRSRRGPHAGDQGFARVGETGGFTRAADSLQMPSATVSKQIQQLEKHLGLKLLERTTRRVRVTSDGAAYYERTRHLLAERCEHANKLATHQLRQIVGAQRAADLVKRLADQDGMGVALFMRTPRHQPPIRRR
jgi:DNA-binding transcriptional LysR family regulator